MDQIKTLLRNYLATGSIKATSRQLKVSKNTIRDYLRRAEAYSADLSALLKLDDESLSRIFYPTGGLGISSRMEVFEQKVEGWIAELRRVGVTRELLWQEYRADYPDGYGYSQFCEHLSRHVARRDLTVALDHTPGEVLMVDFAGKKMTWVDRDSRELHDCEVLVAVLPFSQYSFCIALPSQSRPIKRKAAPDNPCSISTNYPGCAHYLPIYLKSKKWPVLKSSVITTSF